MKFEQECFQIILHSGNARSIAYEALGKVKQGQMEEAKKKFAEAKDELTQAGCQHAQLLQRFVTDESLQVEMLLVHAEDHMSSSNVIVEMVQELMEVYERLERLEN